jgi:hypothetical protein
MGKALVLDSGLSSNLLANLRSVPRAEISETKAVFLGRLCVLLPCVRGVDRLEKSSIAVIDYAQVARFGARTPAYSSTLLSKTPSRVCCASVCSNSLHISFSQCSLSPIPPLYQTNGEEGNSGRHAGSARKINLALDRLIV